jgi:hypothetical protein
MKVVDPGRAGNRSCRTGVLVNMTAYLARRRQRHPARARQWVRKKINPGNCNTICAS